MAEGSEVVLVTKSFEHGLEDDQSRTEESENVGGAAAVGIGQQSAQAEVDLPGIAALPHTR